MGHVYRHGTYSHVPIQPFPFEVGAVELDAVGH